MCVFFGGTSISWLGISLGLMKMWENIENMPRLVSAQFHQWFGFSFMWRWVKPGGSYWPLHGVLRCAHPQIRLQFFSRVHQRYHKERWVVGMLPIRESVMGIAVRSWEGHVSYVQWRWHVSIPEFWFKVKSHPKLWLVKRLVCSIRSLQPAKIQVPRMPW